jgi:hypothetical protein
MTVQNAGAIDVSAISKLGHDEGQDLFVVEVGRSTDLIGTLTQEEWGMQTDCPDWDVRRMYLHVLGAHQSGASIRELTHQLWAGSRYRRAHGGPPHAALSHVQVAEREHLTPAELTSRFGKAGLDAARKPASDACAYAGHPHERRPRLREVVAWIPERHDLPSGPVDAPR